MCIVQSSFNMNIVGIRLKAEYDGPLVSREFYRWALTQSPIQ